MQLEPLFAIASSEPVLESVSLDPSYNLADWPLEKFHLLDVPSQIRWMAASRQRYQDNLRERNQARQRATREAFIASGLSWHDFVMRDASSDEEQDDEMLADVNVAPEAANDNQPRSTRPAWPGIVSSGAFIRGFVPPDYAIDGIIQSGFLYSVTASTGTGKTAILLLISALTAQGLPVGTRETKKGRVLYFAGENPDDVGMRWIGAAHHMGFDPGAIDVHFIPGTFDIPKLINEVDSAVRAIGGVDLVIIDTSAAYFTGTDENANVDMAKHARNLRTLTTLPGSPCVLVACHPTKSADQSNLLPRGGGAFLAEVDGNLVCMRTDTGAVKLHWQGKHRGPDFDPLMFDLATVTAPMLKDSRGRDIPTVLASVISNGEVARRKVEARRDEDDVLLLLEKQPNLSQSAIADHLGWQQGGKPHKRRAQTALTKLRGDRLIEVTRTGHMLTTKGASAVAEVRGQRFHEDIGMAGATAIVRSARGENDRTEAAPHDLAGH